MNYYTSLVPTELVEKLYKAGCPNIGRYEEADGSVKYSEATYADIFDGLIEKGIVVCVRPVFDDSTMKLGFMADIAVGKGGSALGWRTSWHDSANAAIEKAIEIIKKEK